MRSTTAMLVLAACSYSPGVSNGDAPPAGDANVGSDASADSPLPTWMIETIVVDSASPNAVASSTVLATGVTYHLRVSGTVTNVIDSFEGDADFFDFNDPKDDGCCEDIGLGIDDLVVNDHDTKPNWGTYRADHVYEVEWVGEGRAITALFQDTFHGNNIGNLTLEILELR